MEDRHSDFSFVCRFLRMAKGTLSDICDQLNNNFKTLCENEVSLLFEERNKSPLYTDSMLSHTVCFHRNDKSMNVVLGKMNAYCKNHEK